MPNILVVTGSARPNSANAKIVPLVASEVEKQAAQATVVDLAALNLPFFNAPVPPSSSSFTPDNEPAQRWTQLVAESDGVIFVTPEYNHTMTPLQLNAIDWIGKEWVDKKIGLVGYGWTSGAGQAHATAREALSVNLKATVGDDQTNLFFTKDLQPDGTPIDETAVREKIAATVRELVS